MTRIVNAPDGSLMRGMLARIAAEVDGKQPTALSAFMGMVAPPRKG